MGEAEQWRARAEEWRQRYERLAQQVQLPPCSSESAGNDAAAPHNERINRCADSTVIPAVQWTDQRCRH